MAAESLVDIALGLGLIVEETLLAALSSIPFGSLLQNTISLAFRVSKYIDALQESKERAINVKKRCIMISAMLIKHCQDLRDCDFILNDLVLVLEKCERTIQKMQTRGGISGFFKNPRSWKKLIAQDEEMKGLVQLLQTELQLQSRETMQEILSVVETQQISTPVTERSSEVWHALKAVLAECPKEEDIDILVEEFDLPRGEIDRQIQELKNEGLTTADIKYYQSEAKKLELVNSGESLAQTLVVNKESEDFIGPLKDALESLGILQFTFEEIQSKTDFNNRIGRGGNGDVFLATFDGENAAVKRVPLMSDTLREFVVNDSGSSVEGLDNDARMRRWMFFRGLDLLMKCTHKDIVELKGFALDPTYQYGFIVSEFLEHGSVDHILSRLPARKRVQIAIDVGHALQHLHTRGLMHRDIKSANIGLDEHDRAKLLDFDLVKTLRDEQENILRIATSDDVIPGTPGYKDEHYLRLAKDKRYLSDVYSFGVFLMELFTGKLAKDPSLACTNKTHFHVDELKKELQEYNYRVADESVGWSGVVLRKLRLLILNCVDIPEKRPRMLDVSRRLEEILQDIDRERKDEGFDLMQRFMDDYVLSDSEVDISDLAGQIAEYFEKDVESLSDIIETVKDGRNPFDHFTGGRRRKNFAFEQLQRFARTLSENKEITEQRDNSAHNEESEWLRFILSAKISRVSALQIAENFSRVLESPGDLCEDISQMDDESAIKLLKEFTNSDFISRRILNYLKTDFKRIYQLENQAQEIVREDMRPMSPEKLFERASLLQSEAVKNQFLQLERAWKNGESVSLGFPLGSSPIDGEMWIGFREMSITNDSDEIKLIAYLLKMEEIKIARIHLSSNEIGDIGCEKIAQAMQFNTILTGLNLSGNQIGDVGCEAIAKALQSNNTLTHLDISSNRIGDIGCVSIAQALQSNNALIYLVLYCNQIGDVGCEAIAQALQSNNTLTHLDLQLNECSNAKMDQIKQIWRRGGSVYL